MEERKKRKCIAFKCKNDDFMKDKKFHQIPKDVNRAKQWLEAIHRPDLIAQLTEGKVKRSICGDHFTEDSYLDDPNRKNTLKRTAVPILRPEKEKNESTVTDETEHIIKYAISEITVEEAVARIEPHLTNMILIEAKENFLSIDVAKQHVAWGYSYLTKIDFHTVNRNYITPKILDSMKTFCPVLHATHDISLLEVLHNFTLIIHSGCSQMIVIYDTRREKFINYMMNDIYNFETDQQSNLVEIDNYLEYCKQSKFPYSTMFIFDSCDIPKAADCIISSINDPLIPWRIRSIYVQESCFEDFCFVLKSKLSLYPKEYFNDEEFLKDIKNSLIRIYNRGGKVLQKQEKDEFEHVYPIVCFDFDRIHFDSSKKLSATIILKRFQRVEDALKHSKIETGGLATIWNVNLSAALEFAYNLNFSTIWINCLGTLNLSTPFKLRDKWNCLGSHFAFVEFFAKYFPYDDTEYCENENNLIFNVIDNGYIVDNSHHFEYLMQKYEQRILKTGCGNSLIYGNESLTINNLLDLRSSFWRCIYEAVNRYKIKTIVFPLEYEQNKEHEAGMQ